jgi:hypothetical protein
VTLASQDPGGHPGNLSSQARRSLKNLGSSSVGSRVPSTLAEVIPDARARVLEGQTHDDVVPLVQPPCWRSSSRRVGGTETKAPSRCVRSRYSSEML